MVFYKSLHLNMFVNSNVALKLQFFLKNVDNDTCNIGMYALIRIQAKNFHNLICNIEVNIIVCLLILPENPLPSPGVIGVHKVNVYTFDISCVHVKFKKKLLVFISFT